VPLAVITAVGGFRRARLTLGLATRAL
jgi:hypothetical protein